jgi:RNA polymerase sigma-70 factor (ECF subfamily)
MPETESANTVVSGGPEPFDEKKLVARARLGDTGAFSLIVEHYQDRLYNSVYRMVDSADAALDICQEVFIRAFRNLSAFRGDSLFLTYLYRIAFNESLQYRNRRQKIVTVDMQARPDELFDREFLSGQAGDDLLDDESGRQVRAALNSLAPELKEAAVLKDIQGLSYAEAAKALGVSVSQFRTVLGKARNELRAKLKDFF